MVNALSGHKLPWAQVANRLAHCLEKSFLCKQALVLNHSHLLFFFSQVYRCYDSSSLMLTVMATKDSAPSVQSRSTTTPTGQESVTPVSQPSGLGELSAAMVTETNRKLEVIQRAQVSSLVGADKTKEPQDKTPKKQSPTLAARPTKYALEMWVEIETSAGVYSTPKEDSYSVDFAIDAINHTYPGCTSMYLDVASHMLAFYGKKTNPRAGLLQDQGVVASKAIANIPTWMGYFTRWRVRCVSVSKASEILAGCKRLEKESLR